jgi:eukaryotic-like serine/threonine-protein kinase
VTKPEPKEDGEVAGEKSPRTNPAMKTAGRLKHVTLTQAALGDAAPGTVPPPPGITDPYIGATIDGRYFVEAQLGEGGMGVVYRCRHTIIDKKVAMKVLRPDMARNEEVTERFLNEARSASSIGNPHIIDISDFGRLPDGATYFIMEFLTGTPLAQLAEARQALEPARAGYIVLQLTEGLAAAHEAGIIHRDLKPDNIFLIRRGSQDDFVKILDFGIAKASTNSGKLTQAGQVFGTPHYMSPEQASGSPVDHRSDIYAVGVILYELSTGRLPFDADNFMAILTQHMYKAPIAPSQVPGLTRTLPTGLEEIILKCLAKDPGERYQTMTELGSDIERVFAGTLPSASRDMRHLTDNFGSPPQFRSSAAALPEQKPKTKTATLGLLGVAAAAVVGAAVFFATGAEPDPTDASFRAADAAPSAPKAPEETPPTEPTPVIAMKSVAIAVAPLEARVLSAKLEGYVTQEISIDGSERKVSVQLEKVRAPRTVAKVPGQRPTTTPQPKPSPKPIGGGELVNPWD